MNEGIVGYPKEGKRLRVAIQGYEGSFHQIAAEGFIGREIELLCCSTFRKLAAAVAAKDADVGVMAIENSIAGSILPNYSLLQNSSLQVVGEIYLRIRQNLMALPDVSEDDVEEVYSHPMALLQCADYLDTKDWKLVEYEDTALSAKMIAEKGLRNAAAIASQRAAELYGLKVIVPNINTIKNNYTRFLIIKAADAGIVVEGPDKASLYFKIGNEHGSLFSVLKQMEDAPVNMTKLQSYPIPSEPWHYLFHVDMEFPDIRVFNQVVEKMSNASEELHVYGVYKKGTEI